MKNVDNPAEGFDELFNLDALKRADLDMSRVAWSRGYSLQWCARAVTPSKLDEYIILYIKFLADFTAARYKWTSRQLGTMAWLIRTQHPYITMPQLQYFIVRCMAGHFGKFYDKLDPIELMNHLCQHEKDIDSWRRANWDQRPQD